MSYENYENTGSKVRKIWVRSKTNLIKIDNLEPLTIFPKSNNFLKKTYKIPFARDSEGEPKEFEDIYSWSSTTKFFQIDLSECPEWMIPFIDVNLVIGSYTDKIMDDILTGNKLRYEWTHVIRNEPSTSTDKEKNILEVRVYLQVIGKAPLYMELVITATNPRNYYEIPRNKE